LHGSFLHGETKENRKFGSLNRVVKAVCDTVSDTTRGGNAREAIGIKAHAIVEPRERKAVGVGAAGDEFFIENIADHSSTTFSNAEFMRVQGAEGRWAIGSG